ncbi:MAG TPA: carbonate dehydratase [Pyrinomonadaceae bacterium]
MENLEHLLARNRAWSAKMTTDDPDFFNRLARQQTPNYLWIGCSDSRVSANEIVGLLPGEMFVHRNVANVVVHTDLNCLSVIQYAVEVLKVGHIIVCGHYGCGGVKAALDNSKYGLIDNWLRHVQDVKHQHEDALGAQADDAARFRKLCELNVIEQVLSVSRTTIVQNAWESGQELAVHGWIYGLDDGLLRELDICITCQDELAAKYKSAVASSK